MHVTTSEKAGFWLIDELLARWYATPKRYPFNRPDAIIPQTIIPESLRSNRDMLCNFYLAICNHMKGRKTSLQAFKDYIKIWEEKPEFFDPHWVIFQSVKDIEDIFQEYVKLDAVVSARAWMINCRHLIHHYKGSAYNILKGVKDYKEAEHRLLNKRTQTELREAGWRPGFYGFRHKMVCMYIYFIDWEGLIPKKSRFYYPTPADIQNFRIALNAVALFVHNPPQDGIRDYEKISAPWRVMTMKYMQLRKADPRDVADVLWLYGGVMCGNSPLTETVNPKERPPSFLSNDDGVDPARRYLHKNYRSALEQTCLVCFLRDQCNYAIPAAPYFDEGRLILRPRLRVEELIDPEHLRNLKEPVFHVEEDHPPLPL